MYKNMLDYFEETVASCPQKIALRHHEDAMTFFQLKEKSVALAGWLAKELPNTVKRPMAVLMPKCIDIFVADLAVTYSTNFFSNLDIKTPAERLINIVELMQPAMILTDSANVALAQKISGTIPVLNVENFAYDSTENVKAVLMTRMGDMIDTDPFCIINTSGSTGTPKGVVLNHRSFFDFMRWSLDTFHFDGAEVIGSLSPVVFDIFDYELTLMMTKGATIVVLDASMAIFPVRLLQEMKTKKVSFIFWVPTIMVNIANMNLLEKLPLPDLKTVWFAGEVFPTKQFNYWKHHLPNTIFANLYGPIEITLDCLYYIVDREFADNEPLPIGIPCNNTDILLLSDENKLCAEDEEGEICVRGTSLAMGYYNNPEKTAAAFVQNPLNKSYPELIYRTGDIGYRGKNGLIMFRGRKDSLIKHMGYRIELGEIEHVVVNTLKLVKNCCVVYNHTNKEIVLFYEKQEDVDELSLKKALTKEFPRYMVPSVYTQLNELPRNTNGKIDRLTLSKMINK